MTITAWSKSGLASIVDGCSWQVALEKIYKLPSHGSPATALGTAYHAGIEHHERVRILRVRDGATLPLPTFDETLTLAGEVLGEEVADLPAEQWHLHKTSLTELHGQLAQALRHWWSTPIPHGQPGAGGSLRDRLMSMRPVAVEPYFRVDTGASPRPLHGFIDELLYDHATSEWVVVDHKTANSFGRWGHDATGHEVEASAYAYGSELARHLPVIGTLPRMEWHIARKTRGKNARFEGARVVALEVEDMHRVWLEDQMQIADRIVDRNGYTPNPSWNLCSQKWCPFWRGCQVTGELAPGGDGLPIISG